MDINYIRGGSESYLWVIVLVLLMLMGLPGYVPAQTCSCAGAPLISSQSISSASAGNLLIGLTFQHHDISRLYRGSNRIPNPSVVRETHSTLFEANYGITNRLTVTGTFTYVRKHRESGLQSPGEPTTTTSRGIGDGLLMLKYVLHQNTMNAQYQLALGGGVKVPFGRSDLSQNGLTLNADMQPGTGAWDGVAWSYFSKTFAPATTMNLFWYNTFRLTGQNSRFRTGDNYRFGNELLSTVGITNRLLGKFSYILMARYQSTASDRRNGSKMPNTGGKWVYLKPALSFEVAEGLSLRLSGQLPVYQHLNGLQPTTSFTLSGSLFYNFSNRTIF